ncbi:SUKH-4 family immunity protein [Streptomyces fulvoviolaceus]|uniref:SUKH-4 family immunity protein n=1 Tax=Streptomyces fulvoviolaceus TaxID=285535 RepID=UPI0021C0A1C8|nr:SUKH-4 family immunity protein [Streptomyces fulvoviolaceus]MCT9079504.1 SUKH-4 family immunity protein [Streptomyces fulvoviolaceus]
MPETLDEHWARIEAWRDLPARKRRVFSVSGAAAAGKTEFLAQVRGRIPDSDSVWIDCRGLTADAVALRMREACGTGAAPDDLVILLANVQYAGGLLTSSEPARVAGTLAPGFSQFGTRQVWVMAEHDPQLIPVVPDHEYEITLPARPVVDPGVEQPQDEPWLDALATAEIRKVPLSVWQLLCASAETPATPEELLDLAHRRPEILSVAEDDSGVLAVGFVSDALVHVQRRARPCAPVAQEKTAEALLTAIGASPEAWANRPAARYASHALPMHAALAGTLPRVLDDGRLLARCTPAGLYEALTVAYPDGVPYASTAALVHYLEVQGVVPSSQGEWVAWLHHAALTAGRTELADQLVNAGVELPWRTVWSRWRSVGAFGLRPGDAGRVDELGITLTGDALHVITARDTTTGKHATPKYRYLRQEYAPATGAQATAPATVRHVLAEGDRHWIGVRDCPDSLPVAIAHHRDDGWESDSRETSLPPRCPPAVTQGIRFDGTWVLAGREGLFAVKMHKLNQPDPLSFPRKPLTTAHCRAVPWPLPDRAAAALRGEVLREWLEATFGADACHRLVTDQLPPGVRHEETRRFLTQTGLPEVRDFLHLSITPRGDRPLHEVPWPGQGRDIPRHLRAQHGAPSNGPFYELGSWMYSRLLLDGTTGRLLRDTTGGMAEPLAGSSLLQFFAMVRLFDEFRRTHHPDAPDHKDARISLATWCRQIDPDAAQGEVWTHILEGYDFEDSTWDLATYGDEWV